MSGNRTEHGTQDRSRRRWSGRLDGGGAACQARALIHNPSAVLADEPTASLDTERAFKAVETFANLIHEQNHAGIMVTHDLCLTQYVDQVVQMRDGQVVTVE